MPRPWLFLSPSAKQWRCCSDGSPLTVDHRDARRQAATTLVGFEPTRGDPIGFAGRRLSHLAKVSFGRWLSWPAPCRNHGQPLSLAPRPASPCQRSAASEPAGQRSIEAAASAAKSSGAAGEPLGASLTLDGRSLPPRWRHRGHGTTVARATRDRRAGSSERLCPHCLLFISHLLLCRLPSLLPRQPRTSLPATAQLAERLAADSLSDQTVPSLILGGRIWRGAAKRNALDTASEAKMACATRQPNVCLEPNWLLRLRCHARLPAAATVMRDS